MFLIIVHINAALGRFWARPALGISGGNRQAIIKVSMTINFDPPPSHEGARHLTVTHRRRATRRPHRQVFGLVGTPRDHASRRVARHSTGRRFPASGVEASASWRRSFPLTAAGQFRTSTGFPLSRKRHAGVPWADSDFSIGHRD